MSMNIFRYFERRCKILHYRLLEKLLHATLISLLISLTSMSFLRKKVSTQLIILLALLINILCPIINNLSEIYPFASTMFPSIFKFLNSSWEILYATVDYDGFLYSGCTIVLQDITWIGLEVSLCQVLP